MAIPRIIHYFWVGGSPLPDKNRAYIDSWSAMCPGWEIKEWNESSYDFTKNRYMREAYEAKKWGFVPDYARYDIIYRYGGFYLDTDVELLKSLEPLTSERCVIALDRYGAAANGLLFAAEAGSEPIAALKSVYDARSFYKADGSLDLTPSPVLSTAALAAFGLERQNRLQRLPLLTAYPSEYFDPYDEIAQKLAVTGNTYSVHWYDATWYDAKQRREREALRFAQRYFGKKLGYALFIGYVTLAYLFKHGAAATARKIRQMKSGS